MGKIGTSSLTVNDPVRPTPYEIPERRRIGKKDEGKEKKRTEFAALLAKLSEIIPRVTKKLEGKDDCLDLMEDTINYICDLEKELGPKMISLLHENPDLYKMLSRKNNA